MPIFGLAFGTVCEAFQGYNVVITTSAPTEAEFLSISSNVFTAQVSSNPFIGNTYSINLLEQNPNYVLPGQVVPSAPCQLDQDVDTIVAETTWTGVYMFGSGMTYQQNQQIGLIGALGNLCGYATNYNLVETSTTTFNKNTCQDVIGTIENELFNESLSTPTVIPPEDAQ
jgi:hypothetical protein